MAKIHLSYVGPLEKCEYRVAENSIEEIWHLIDLFASEDVILENSTVAVKKEVVSFVAESVVQAEEFDFSSTSSTEHTKPLQLYYCFHNLTKAILARNNNRISPGYHGLKKVQIPSSRSLLDVSARLDEGVFWDLLLLTGVSPTRNLRINFDDLLKRCAYTTWEYETAYRKKSMILIPRLDASISLSELEITIEAPLGDLAANWKILLPSFAKYFELRKSEPGRLIFGLNRDAPRGSLGAIQNILDETVIFNVFARPECFFLPNDKDECYWPQEAYLYALSFILSSLVRYYPDYWQQEIMAKKKNRWLVRRLNWVMRRVLPKHDSQRFVWPKNQVSILPMKPIRS
jgi:hypothetical protein